MNRLLAYGLGRLPTKGEAAWVSELENAFIKDGYQLPKLLRRIATDARFYRAPVPESVNGRPIMAAHLAVGDAAP